METEESYQNSYNFLEDQAILASKQEHLRDNFFLENLTELKLTIPNNVLIYYLSEC